MTISASGTFAVSLNPQPAYNQDEAALLGRMSIDRKKCAASRAPLGGCG